MGPLLLADFRRFFFKAACPLVVFFSVQGTHGSAQAMHISAK